MVLALLRQRWRDLDRQPPIVADDRERLLAEVAGGVPVADAGHRGRLGGGPRRRRRRATWTPPRAAAGAPGRPRTAIADALAAYQELKRRRGVVDLDDLLTLVVRELTSDPFWADAVRWRFRHVLVDEAQDLNPIQYRLLELIVGTHQRPVPRR